MRLCPETSLVLGDQREKTVTHLILLSGPRRPHCWGVNSPWWSHRLNKWVSWSFQERQGECKGTSSCHLIAPGLTTFLKEYTEVENRWIAVHSDSVPKILHDYCSGKCAASRISSRLHYLSGNSSESGLCLILGFVDPGNIESLLQTELKFLVTSDIATVWNLKKSAIIEWTAFLILNFS